MNSPSRNYKYVKPKTDGNLVPGSSSNSKIFLKTSIESTHVEPQSFTANVYINPNFKLQNPAMHINPKICAKPLIHVNPKMVHDIANSNQNLQNNIMGTMKTNVDNNITQRNIKRSIYVNPTLLKDLSSSDHNSNEVHRRELPTCSKISVKSTCDKRVTPKKIACDSSVVLLSHRKLVRVTGTTNNLSGTSTISQCRLREPINFTEKKSGNITQKIVKVPSLMNNKLQRIDMRYNVPKVGIVKSKVTKYKIDRTILHASKIKGGQSPLKRKVVNNTVGLVTIGGIVYRSSKNRLIRRSCLLKRKRSTNGNNDKLITAKKSRNNKETLNCTSETNNTLGKIRRASNVFPKTTHKNNISNKVKQRSIQILRNKMRKNNQPCLIFQRFGYCQNYTNGLCPKQHDKKQVSICKKFLQGKCLLDKCPLSHDVGPEKMPTCKYFLDGCCIRDTCPYLHVKVSANTSICIDFLQGYCAKGNECQRRHEYLCPEFDKTGNCSKGKYCVYPHKSHSSSIEENTKYLSKKVRVVKKYQATSAKVDTETSNLECRLRYYETTDNSTDSLEKKKENILKKLQIMKATLSSNVPTADLTGQMQINKTDKSLVKEDESKSITSVTSNTKKRAPIGSLPAYIPIN